MERLKCFRGLTQGWTDPHSRAVDSLTDRQTDRQTHRQTGRQTHRQAGRQVGPGPGQNLREYACAVSELSTFRFRFGSRSEGRAAHWYCSLSGFHPRHLGCPQIARVLQDQALITPSSTPASRRFPPKSLEWHCSAMWTLRCTTSIYNPRQSPFCVPLPSTGQLQLRCNCAAPALHRPCPASSVPGAS